LSKGRGPKDKGRAKAPAAGVTDGNWTLDRRGVLGAARQVPSPNCDDRPAGTSVALLVIHNISLPPGQFGGEAVVEFFTNRLNPSAHPYYREIADLKVSSHFFIRRDGELIQFVPCGKRAWHAGQSEWRGRTRCNDFSVGVELEGADDLPFTESQYSVLADLAQVLKRTYPIEDVVGHCDIATPAGRKTDPGPLFDWPRFNRLLQDQD
jgi:AmpD protein